MRLYPVSGMDALRASLTTKILPSYMGNDAKGLRARHKSPRQLRAPKKGEWYLSGAIPMAYRAPNDLRGIYYIMDIVEVETKTTVTTKIIKVVA